MQSVRAAEFSGLTAKLDFKGVRYYVYDPAYPNAGMSEIIWRTQTTPLPGTPPRAPVVEQARGNR
ncbi:MAG TPA: hypothetical protein VFW94_00755 [Candidatus Acidoferrales bacterium]|nr:hypothetical protein [Candidatus Acidoferrales bacterium]